MMTHADHGPVRIKDVLGSLLAKYGYARSTAQKDLETAWRESTTEEIRRHATLGALRRGVLEILVDSSAVLARLESFEKVQLLEGIQSRVTHSEIKGLKFRKL